MSDFEKRTEVDLNGEVVKVGEKICFPVENTNGLLESCIKCMKDRVGLGPFVLEGVELIRRGETRVFFLRFKSDKGDISEAPSEYFVKYNNDNDLAYKALINKLSEMHKGHSTDGEKLCMATVVDFNNLHDDYACYPQMQNELFYLARKLGLSWAKI